MEEENKPIKLKMQIMGGKGSVIPGGAVETLTIEIIDNLASFHFLDCKTTREFAVRENQDGVQSVYNERLKKTVCKYPDMSKTEILKHIKNRLIALGAKNRR